MRRAAAMGVVVLALAVASPVRADSPTLPQDPGYPWAGGVFDVTPMETLAGQVATSIVGRTMAVRCEDELAWHQLSRTFRFDQNWVWGYVIGGMEFAELSPMACHNLQQFALAQPKPTRCPATRTEQQEVTQVERVREWKRARVRVRVKGRVVQQWRRKQVWVERSVRRLVPGTVQVHVPCYVNGRAAASTPDGYWRDYDNYAMAITTLAHESFHLKGFRDEAQTECYAIQTVAATAERLGADPDDARAIAAYYYDRPYAAREEATPEYWSSECRDGGALDLNPGDAAWP